jgi:DNA-binding MarR family transcriptional regulator
MSQLLHGTIKCLTWISCYHHVMESPSTIAGKEAWRRVTWTLRRADHAVQRAKEPGLRAVGVPQAHYALLMQVHTFPGLSGAEIGRRLGVTTQAVALLATKLEAQGLLERRTHPRHHNVKEFHITDTGLDVLLAAEKVVVETEQCVCDALGPERSEQLRGLLDAVIEAVSAVPVAGE